MSIDALEFIKTTVSKHDDRLRVLERSDATNTDKLKTIQNDMHAMACALNRAEERLTAGQEEVRRAQVENLSATREMMASHKNEIGKLFENFTTAFEPIKIEIQNILLRRAEDEGAAKAKKFWANVLSDGVKLFLQVIVVIVCVLGFFHVNEKVPPAMTQPKKEAQP